MHVFDFLGKTTGEYQYGGFGVSPKFSDAVLPDYARFTIFLEKTAGESQHGGFGFSPKLSGAVLLKCARFTIFRENDE